MANVAKLSTSGGALLMPARSPYDRELVFENAEFYAGRHGSADLEFSSPRRLLRVIRVSQHDPCPTCGQLGRQIAFVSAGASYCRGCLHASITRSPSRTKS